MFVSYVKSYLSFVLNELLILSYVEITIVIGEKLKSHDNYFLFWNVHFHNWRKNRPTKCTN